MYLFIYARIRHGHVILCLVAYWLHDLRTDIATKWQRYVLMANVICH